jgi:alginate O-acetyltransferase complex protein AlgI
VLFTTLKYAVFFAVAFVGSWALCFVPSLRGGKGGEARFNPWPRIVFLLGLSYGFYAAWDWHYLPLIFGSSTVDFFLARAIGGEERPARRRAMLLVTVVLNLGFLGFFKYWNFTLENARLLAALVQGAPPPPASALRVLLPPVGISFFTFESMSYVVDVYRGELKPHASYLRYLLFVSFFPHLVAGPIVRPRDLLPQFERRPLLAREDGAEALFLIALGLVKKLVISDQLAQNLVDRVFERPASFSSVEVLAGVYGYAVQIYCDFSGYTDIAIGSALLLGVRFPKNFDAPYKAADLADFWRRWHISLSSWLRDYLYIPLGGNRGSEAKTHRNLMLTMLLGGLWHGANWTFVFWGFLHGFGLVIVRAFQRATKRAVKAAADRDGDPPEASEGASPYRGGAQRPPPPMPAWQRLLCAWDRARPRPWARALGVIVTFHWVCLAWIFFRAPSFDRAEQMLRQIAAGTTFHPNLPPIVLGVLGVGLLSHYVPEDVYTRARKGYAALPAPAQGALLFAVALLLHEAASTAAVPFVYFQF